MNRNVIAYLNLIISTQAAHTHLSKDEARLALHAIETQTLLAGALRLVLEAGRPEARVAAEDHARKALKLHDDYVLKCTAPKPAALAPAKKPVDDQDVADLV